MPIATTQGTILAAGRPIAPARKAMPLRAGTALDDAGAFERPVARTPAFEARFV